MTQGFPSRTDRELWRLRGGFPDGNPRAGHRCRLTAFRLSGLFASVPAAPILGASCEFSAVKRSVPREAYLGLTNQQGGGGNGMNRLKKILAGGNAPEQHPGLEPVDPAPASDAAPERNKGLWSDLMGRMATRGIQLLVLGVLAAAVVIGLLQVTTIAIPLLIATILACALWPIIVRLRRHLSDLLSAWSVFLGALIVLGAIGTAIVYSVISQWDELVRQAQRGFDQLSQAVQQVLNNLPFGIDQQRLEDLGKSASQFATSTQFSAGALHTLGTAGELVTEESCCWWCSFSS